MKMNVLTTEYVHVDVTSDGDLLGHEVVMALPLAGELPTDWLSATWDSSVTSSPFRARILIGPAGGEMTLEAGTSYDLWIRILDNPEIPVRRSGSIVAS